MFVLNNYIMGGGGGGGGVILLFNLANHINSDPFQIVTASDIKETNNPSNIVDVNGHGYEFINTVQLECIFICNLLITTFLAQIKNNIEYENFNDLSKLNKCPSFECLSLTNASPRKTSKKCSARISEDLQYNAIKR